MWHVSNFLVINFHTPRRWSWARLRAGSAGVSSTWNEMDVLLSPLTARSNIHGHMLVHGFVVEEALWPAYPRFTWTASGYKELIAVVAMCRGCEWNWFALPAKRGRQVKSEGGWASTSGIAGKMLIMAIWWGKREKGGGQNGQRWEKDFFCHRHFKLVISYTIVLW